MPALASNITVTELCARYQIGRRASYKLIARYDTDELPALGREQLL